MRVVWSMCWLLIAKLATLSVPSLQMGDRCFLTARVAPRCSQNELDDWLIASPLIMTAATALSPC